MDTHRLPFVALTTLLFTLGCKDDEPTDDSQSEQTDADGDGFTAAEDCDDNDPTVHPDAEEVCDGTDQDCDGQADNGVGAAYWVDNDGDGYGGVATGLVCALESGMSEVGGDCNDEDASVAPGLADPCDGVDNNCDGLIDEDEATTWYRDDDGDGYGDPERVTESCSRPGGYSSNAADCDDDNASIHPKASEVCGDGVDNNCDSEGCRYEDLLTAEVYATYIPSSEVSDYMGDSVATTGPWDTTKHTLVAGAPYSDYGTSGGGAVHVFTAAPVGSYSRDVLLAVYSKETYAQLGHDVASAGDLDGDGSEELLVGAPGANVSSSGSGTGALYVIGGGASGVRSLSDVYLTAFYGRTEGSSLGMSVAVVDTDGDGTVELLAGAPSEQDSSGVQVGAVYVFPSTATGDQKWSSNRSVVYGDSGTSGWGMDIANAGDTNGDGAQDLLVGAAFGSASGTDYAEGEVALFRGPLAGTEKPSSADLRVQGSTAELYLGFALADGADLDNDGYDDLAFCAPGASDYVWAGGAAYIVSGTGSGTVQEDAAQATVGLGDEGYYGCQSLATADLDGDGWVDLILGSPSSSLNASSAGALYFAYGPFSGTSLAEDLGGVLASGRTGTALGVSVVAEDLDGDGAAEVVGGGVGYSTSDGTGGRVYLFPGLGL